MLDLLITGKYGLLTEQRLLGTTSNNITNVNTEGYIRKRTNVYTNVVDWGVGESFTSREFNQYVQREMFHDQASVAYYTAYAYGMNAVDQALSSDSLSISEQMNKFFSSMGDAVDNPTSIANREELLGNCQYLTENYNNLATFINQEIIDVNAMVDDDITKVNGLLEGIYRVNRQLLAVSDKDDEVTLQMLDKRDELVSQLSEVVDLSYKVESNGSYCVYMQDGTLLANNDVYARFTAKDNEFDGTRKELYVDYTSMESHDNTTHIHLDSTRIGGELGGYLLSTCELRQTQRELGRLGVATMDAFNVQNKAGFTLEGVAGGDIFELSPSHISCRTSNPEVSCTLVYNEGDGEKLTAHDYKVIYGDGQYNLYEVGEYGDEVLRMEYSADTAGNGTYVFYDEEGNLSDTITYDAATGVYTNAKGLAVDAADVPVIMGNGSMNLQEYGFTLNFGGDITDTSKSSYVDQNVFYIQPTYNAAYTLSTAINKPEDFAFASAVRTRTGDNNYGNAVISLTNMLSTGDDMGVSVNSDTKVPQFNSGSPQTIVTDADGNYWIFSNAAAGIPRQNSDGDFELSTNEYTYNNGTEDVTIAVTAKYSYDETTDAWSYTYVDADGNDLPLDSDGNITDGSGNVIGTPSHPAVLGYADASTKGEQLFANTTWIDGTHVAGYPGYEVSVQGTVKQNDSFTIEINEDGESDNSNGIYMNLLQTTGLVRAEAAGASPQTLTEGYATLLGELGSDVLSANIALDAATAKCEQTTNLYSSQAGVNLDEEAANLLRYQQCYQACSKIITASQTIFESLISSIR